MLYVSTRCGECPVNSILEFRLSLGRVTFQISNFNVQPTRLFDA